MRFKGWLSFLNPEWCKDKVGEYKVLGKVKDIFGTKNSIRHQPCADEDGTMLLCWKSGEGLITVCTTCGVDIVFNPKMYFDDEDFWDWGKLYNAYK